MIRDFSSSSRPPTTTPPSNRETDYSLYYSTSYILYNRRFRRRHIIYTIYYLVFSNGFRIFYTHFGTAAVEGSQFLPQNIRLKTSKYK